MIMLIMMMLSMMRISAATELNDLIDEDMLAKMPAKSNDTTNTTTPKKSTKSSASRGASLSVVTRAPVSLLLRSAHNAPPVKYGDYYYLICICMPICIHADNY